VLTHPDSATARQYQDMATWVVKELAGIHTGNNQPPVLSYSVGEGMVLTLPDGSEHEFPPLELRLICKCASCVQEGTNIRIATRETVDPDIYPTHITPMGNYAAAVNWSDGTSSCIFPFQSILEELVDR